MLDKLVRSRLVAQELAQHDGELLTRTFSLANPCGLIVGAPTILPAATLPSQDIGALQLGQQSFLPVLSQQGIDHLFGPDSYAANNSVPLTYQGHGNFLSGRESYAAANSVPSAYQRNGSFQLGYEGYTAVPGQQGVNVNFGQESHAAFNSGPLAHQERRNFPRGQQNSQLDSSWASNGFVPVRPYSNNFHSGLMANQLAQNFGSPLLSYSPQGPGLFFPFNSSISPNQGFLGAQDSQATLHNAPRPTSHLQLPLSEVSELDDKQDEGNNDEQDEGDDDEQDEGDDDEQDEGDGDQQRENTPRRAPYGTGRMAQQNERLHARGLCVKCREQNPDLWRKSCPACRIKSAALLTL